MDGNAAQFAFSVTPPSEILNFKNTYLYRLIDPEERVKYEMYGEQSSSLLCMTFLWSCYSIMGIYTFVFIAYHRKPAILIDIVIALTVFWVASFCSLLYAKKQEKLSENITLQHEKWHQISSIFQNLLMIFATIIMCLLLLIRTLNAGMVNVMVVIIIRFGIVIL